MEKIHQQLIEGIRKYFRASGLTRAVVGVSGGIDSTLTLKLGVDALGAEKITAISMPQNGLSSEENITHAREFCKKLGVNYFYQPINNFVEDFRKLAWNGSEKTAPNNEPAARNETATRNTYARIRAVLLYHYANSNNALVLGTSNKSEILLGYGTKYGDLAADLEVIGDLFKDEVYALSKHLKIPQEFIDKKPTAELFKGQTDEAELGASYSELDPILKKMAAGLDEKKLITQGMNPALVHLAFTRFRKNKHKSEMPPTINLNRHAM